MNSADRARIAKSYMALNGIYGGQPLPKESVSYWLDAVADMNADDVSGALRAWLNDPKAIRLPTPGQIRAIVYPQVDPVTIGVQAASLMLNAVPKFGWQQSSAAKEYMGELAWLAVHRLGGWQYVCEYLGTRQLPLTMVQAQVRDICSAQIKLGEAGLTDYRPALPEPKKKPANLLQGDFKKLIPSTTKPEGGE